MKEFWALFSTAARVKTLTLASITQAAVELPVFGFGALALSFYAKGLSTLEVGLLPCAFFLGAMLTSRWFGSRADLKGIRVPLSSIQLISGIMLVCAAFTENYWLLLFETLIYGTANGPGMALTTKALGDWFQEARATAISVKMVVMSFAGAIVVWYLADFGFTGGFLILGAVQLVSALANFLFYQEYADSTLRVMSAASDERTAQWDVRKDRNYRCLRFAGMVFGIVQYTFVVFVMRFLTGVGLEKSEAKDLLFYSLVLAAVGRIAMSWMSDSWCEGMRKPVLRLNLLGGALTMAVLAFSAFIPFWLVEVGVVAFGFFALTTGVMNQSLGAELAPKGKNGEGAGYATMAVKFGQMFGPPIFGGIVWASQFVLPSGYHFAIGWSLFAALLAIAWVYAGRIVETKSPVKGSGERASATARASRRLKSAA